MTRRRVSISLFVAALMFGGALLAAGCSRHAPPTPGVEAGKSEMVRVPGGTFLMGCSPGDSECEADEKPAHQVTIKAFWMDATPVTNAAYRQCVAAGSCRAVDEKACYKWDGRSWNPGGALDSSFKGDNQPVVCVDWNDAVAFCRWSGKRLPTEAEAEFAARGGTTGARYGDLDAVAWHSGNSGGKPHPVAQKQPNAFRLYDTLGNVWEWCADWYNASYYAWSPADSPDGPSSGTARVLRGGSWFADPASVRASYRFRIDPSDRGSVSGFRCARP